VIFTHITNIKVRILGSFFMDPEDIRKINRGTIWKFVKGTGLL
jgi:hypothetical protein